MKKTFKFLFIYIPLGFFAFSAFWILLLKFVPVYFTPLMAIRSVQHLGDDSFYTYKRWKPITQISDNMILAVMAAEDNRFLEHNGLDFEAIDKAIEYNKRGKRTRGASTISQQTAKNVFLFPSRTWVRKGLEVYFTFGIELAWSKKRIMEVYLNVAEMGRGLYGAEAAANMMFSKKAKNLTVREASLIAAALPNPQKRNAGNPTPYLSRRASRITNLMYKIERPDWLNKNLKKSKRK